VSSEPALDGFESLLDALVPGSGRTGAPRESAQLPASLGLETGPVLGSGAHGDVIRARDPALGRDVAVKLLRPNAGPEGRAALLDEARVTASLEHPAVLAVYRVHEWPQGVAVQYQLAPQTTLGVWLQRAPPLLDRVRVLASVSAAVAAAHASGVVHGDLHGGNIVVDDSGQPYVLDWSGGQLARSGEHAFSGHPSTAAPEQLMGAPRSMAGDVYALGVLLWESMALRPMRPRGVDEPLGDFLSRWGRAEPPALPDSEAPPALVQVLRHALGSPAGRPAASDLSDTLVACLGAQAEVARRTGEADGHLAAARDGLTRFRELGQRFAEEERVALVQRSKVPGHAPIVQKRPLWDAEDRVAKLAAEQTEVWTAATEAATLAGQLDPTSTVVRSTIAELWWERLRDAELHHDRLTAAVARRRVTEWDDGRYTHVLSSDAAVSLELAEPLGDAEARIYRYASRDRVLVPELVETVATPLRKHPLAPGSWLIEVSAPGCGTARYPVLLGRLQHHRGVVRLYTEAQIGEGWVYVPAGPFRLGGDPRARQPLDPCEPILGDRFVQETCVTSRRWLEFLESLPLDEARTHVPGEAGLFGSFQPFWEHDGERWVLPEGWDPQWPVMAVNLADAQAYARWLSVEEGRVVRLPTEEEWEKCSRGVDGRSYPWGDAFDPTFAHMRSSQPGPPHPAPVGQYPVDCSVYGALDTSGGMREWTSSLFDEGAHVIRGGTWGDDAHDLLCANRAGLMPMIRYSYISFRLVTEQPRPTDRRL